MSYFFGISKITRVQPEENYEESEKLIIQESEKLISSLEQQSNKKQQAPVLEEQVIEDLYNGIVFQRRLCRLCLHLIVIWFVIGVLCTGYFTTVKEYYWNANEMVDDIIISTGNCFLNISESQDYPQFKVQGKGSIDQQVQCKGEILDKGKANISIQNPSNNVRSCLVDIMLPRKMANIDILCSIDSECIIVFAQQELYVQNNFNATCEKNARMQMNIRNIQTNKFTYISNSVGTLFMNNILTSEGYISIAKGELVIQSTKSFQLIYTSQSHAICARGFQLIDQYQEDCYISEQQNQTIMEKICKGQISICEKSSCDIQQKIQVIGNQATIYANILQDIGKPIIIESNEVEIFSTQVFKQNIDFDQDSLYKIQQFMNTSGSADVAVRIDAVGSYLLQHSYTTHWSFFSNPSYANFQPWWLSAFSAGFLNPTFTYLTVSIKPGLCPWNPILNSKQKIQIRNLIKQSFNTTYGEAIYIDVDQSLRSQEILDQNESYFGLTYLQQKQQGKVENWFILDDVANTIVYEYLKQNQNDVGAIVLSLASSLIFSVVCVYFLQKIMKELEVYVLNSCSQFHHYSTTTTRSASNKINSIVNDIIAKLKQQPNKREPPLVLSIFTYIFSFFAQNFFKSAPILFIDTLFRWSNKEETQLFYANELDDFYLSIDLEQLKEMYEQFCYLNKMTIESLAQYTYYFNSYGFELAKKQNVQVLSKIKLNPCSKHYQSLSLEEKQSENSIEIFFQTQCLLTGIPSDTVNSDILYKAYLKFCGNHFKVEEFNIQEISKKYHFSITDKKIVQLTKIPFFVENQVFINHLGFFSRIAYLLKTRNQQDISQPIYILKRDDQQNLTYKESMKFQLNPFEQIKRDELQKYYKKFPLIWQCILYNLTGFGFSYDYEKNSILMKYFSSIYMHGWWKTDIIVVLGNAIIFGLSISPLLYFIIIMNISYSPYSIYNPETLLFIEDIYLRPWIIFDQFRYFDTWGYAFSIVLMIYTIFIVLLQTQGYYYTQFPDEMSYMMDQQRLKRGTTLFSHLQWFMFLILAFCMFLYFGLIIVWVLLGSIINPNFYLVYSSSALSLVAFITAQLSQIKETYQMTYQEIKKIIKKSQFSNFKQLIRPIIKKQERFQDSSIFVLASNAMSKAKQSASKLGFGNKLEKLCNLIIQIIENSEPLDLAQVQSKLQNMKEEFILTSSKIFLQTMKEQFKIPESLAKLLLQSYFIANEFLEGLLKEIEIKTQIPFPILKWFYQTLNDFKNLKTQIHSKTGRNDLLQFLEQINQQLLELFTQKVISNKEIKEQDLIIVIEQLLINQSENNILSQFTKIQDIIKQPINKQFELKKRSLEVFMKLYNFNQKCQNKKKMEQIQKDYSFELFTFIKPDQTINFLYQFLFNNQEYLIIPKEVLKQHECNTCSQLLCKIFVDLQKQIDPKSESNFSLYKFQFIVEYLRNQFPLLPCDKQNKKPLNEIQQQKKTFLEIGITYISLCTKNWKQELQINLEGYDLKLFYDILYIGSNFLWSSKYFKYFDEDSETNIQLVQREERLSNRNLIKLISQYLDMSENAVIGLILILKKEIKNQSHYLQQAYIEISKKSTQIGGWEIIKFVIELLSKSNFEDIFPFLLQNQELKLSQELIKVFIKMVIKSKDIVIFKLFNGCFIYKTILSWEADHKQDQTHRFFKMDNFFSRQKQSNFKEYYNQQVIHKYKKSSQKFGYCYNEQDGKGDQEQEFEQKEKMRQLKNQLQNLKEQFSHFKQFLKEDENRREDLFQMEDFNQSENLHQKEDLNQKEDFNESEDFNQRDDLHQDEDLNRYPSPKLTFFNFLLHINFKGKKYENNFIDVIKKHVNSSMQLFEILKKQDYILRQQELDSEEPNNVFAKGIQNLSYIIQFLDLEKMEKAINFFVEQNQSSENNKINKKILQPIFKVIQIEKTVSTARQKLYQIIPYQLDRFSSLFIDQIFQTTLGFHISFCKDILRIFKYELPEFIITEQISINKKSKLTINQKAQPWLKNFIPFAEPIMDVLFSDDKNKRNQAINKSLKNFRVAMSKYTHNLLKQLIIEIVDKDYKVIFYQLRVYASQYFEKETYDTLVDIALQLVEGFIETEAIFSRKDSNTLSRIFTIVGDYLKYYLTSDLNIFIELVQIHCNKIVRKEKQNQKAIFALFSLLSSQYQYEELNQIYYLNISELKITNFLTNCMFSKKKSILLEETEIQQILKKKCYIQDFNILIDIANILDYNSVNPDILIEKLRLELHDSKFFKMVFAFKMQIRSGQSWKQFKEQYNLLVQQRKQIYQELGIKSDMDTLEVINYFSYPRPLNFIFLLDNIKIFQKDDPTSLFVPGILGIVKYDQFNRYKNKSFDCIQHRQKRIQQLSQSDKQDQEDSLFYIAQASDQDLQEAFQFLQLAIGLDQILINAIFQENLIVLEKYIQTEHFKIEQILDFFSILSELNTEIILTIIEYETLQTAQYKNECLQNGKQNLVVNLTNSVQANQLRGQLKQKKKNYQPYNKDNQSKDYTIKKFDEITRQLSLGKGKLSQKFPLSQIILINALKEIRQIKQSFLAQKKKQINLKEKSIEIKELLSIIVIIYERYLYFNNQKQFFNFNFKSTIKLLYQGIFGTEDENCQLKLDNLILYPNLSDVFQNSTDKLLDFGKYFQHQYKFSEEKKKNILKQFWDDILKNDREFRCCVGITQEIIFQGQNLKTQPNLDNLITQLENFQNNEYVFIKEEDWKTSIKIMQRLKNQKVTDIELTSQLMHYYAGDFRFLNQQKEYSEENSLISFQSMVVNLIKQVEGPVEKLKFLINLIYNPKILGKENRNQIWEDGENSIFIDIISAQVSLRLEQFRCIGEWKDQAQLIPDQYLYSSIGDDYEDYSEYDQIPKQSNKKLSELIDTCQEIQESLKFPLKILFRCFLGDVDAWYALINSIFELKKIKFERESLEFIRDFIYDLLSQLKVQKQWNTYISQEKIKSTSFLELSKQHANCKLFQLIEALLLKRIWFQHPHKITNQKQQISNPQLTFCDNIFQFYDCIVEQNFEKQLNSEQFQEFFYRMISYQVYNKNQSELIYAINFLISILVKKHQDIEQYETIIQVLKEDQNKGAWIFIKGIICTDESKDINIAINYFYQFFETLEMKEFYPYLQLLTSISLYKYQDRIPQQPDVVLYPFIWIENKQNSNEDQFKKFKQIQNNHKTLKKDIKYDMQSNQISQYLITTIFENKKLIGKELEGLDQELFNNESTQGHQNLNLLQIIQKRLIQQIFSKDDLEHQLQIQFLQKVIDLEKNNNKKQEQSQDDQIQLQEIQEITQSLFKNPEKIFKEDEQNKQILAELYEFYKSKKIESLNKMYEQIDQIQKKQEKDQNNNKEKFPIKQLFDMASELKKSIQKSHDEIEKFSDFSEEKLLELINPIMEKYFQMNKQKLQAFAKTLISINNKRFSEISTEFYSIFQIHEFNRTNITNFMENFYISIETPIKLINEKLNSIAHLDSSSHYKNLRNVQKKIEETIDLSLYDIFKILDNQGRRVVNPQDLLQLLKLLHIDITHHKLREILVKIKGEVLNMETCSIDFYEFKEIMRQLKTQSLLLSLSYLGISKQQLFLTLLLTVIYLGLVLTFILIGVKALAIPGTFASVVNALLPMIGGFGLNKQATNKQIKALNQNIIIEIVQKAIKMISEK